MRNIIIPGMRNIATLTLLATDGVLSSLHSREVVAYLWDITFVPVYILEVLLYYKSV